MSFDPCYGIAIRLVLVTCTVAACSTEQPVGGTQVVSFELDFVLPESDQAPLTSIGQLLLAPGGHVVVNDSRDTGVLVFDEGGTFQQRIGGRGEGPREFASHSLVGLDADTLWVIDSRLRRVTHFTLDGELVDELISLFTTRQPPLAFQPIGVLPGRTVLSLFSDERVIEQFLEADTLLFGFVGANGLEPMGKLAYGQTSLAVPLPQIDGHISARNPFGRPDVLAIDPNGSGIALVQQPDPQSLSNATYRISLLAPRGDAIWSVNVPYVAEPLPAVEVDSFVQTTIAGLADAGVMNRSELEAAMRAALVIPVSRPPVPAGTASIVFDDEERLWIHRTNGTWEIVAPNGYVGTAQPPEGFAILAVANNLVWGAARDERNVPVIARYRVVTR